MATVKVQIDRSKEKKDGTCPVVLRINHNGQFRISLELSVKTDQFDDGRIVNHPQHITLNSFLKRTLADANNII